MDSSRVSKGSDLTVGTAPTSRASSTTSRYRVERAMRDRFRARAAEGDRLQT